MSKEWNRNLTNNSGQGNDAVVLDIVAKKFNWGAFFFNFIWGIFNNTFITLIVIPVAFIPIIGGILCFGLQIWFGIMGNKWAWQNKQWKSVEHFHQVQKRWAIATAVLFTFTILCALLAVLTPFLISAPGSKYDHTKKMGLNILHQNTLIMETKDIKCGLTSAELTKCFAKQMNIEEFIKVYGPIKDDYHKTASRTIDSKKDTYYSINNQQNRPKPVVHTPHSLYDTFLTIPENITAIGKTLDKSIEMAENIVTSDKVKVRSVPRFTKQWLDSELLLFYILFVNDKTCIGKSYGYSDKTVDRRLETVMSILKERNLIS